MSGENPVKASEGATQTVLIHALGPFSLPSAAPVTLLVIAVHFGNAMSKSKLATKSAACCFLMLALTWETADAPLHGTATTHLVPSDTQDVI